MLIGIDASRADRHVKTGVEWYASHLIQALKHAAGQEAHSWLLYSDQPLSKALGTSPLGWHGRFLTWPPRYLWTQLRLSYELFRQTPDVLFVPAHVLPRVIPGRSVVTVHDVGFFRHPELYTRRQCFWQALSTRDTMRRATRIITITEYSKQEIVHFCGVDPDRITVTYLGVDHMSAEPLSEAEKREVKNRYRIPGPYFLFVGRLDTKKNLLTLIEAFRRYKEDRGLGDPTSLVLAGMPTDGYGAIRKAIEHAALQGSIIETGYVSEDDKRALLSDALALVHPTWYEGFGFTPLEAMVMNCPVICSRVSSLPEVVGVDNALWFDPADPEALAQALDRIVREDTLRQTLQERGRAWVTRYTWKKTAAQTLHLLTNWDGR